MTPPGGAPTAATRGDYFLVSEVSPGTYEWTFLNVGFDAPAATTTVAGIVCLATDALAQAGTNATTALTPAAATSAFIPKTCVTAKGTLITGTAANTPAGLPVGADGCVLFACSAASTGLCWGPGVGPATPTVLGTVLGRVNLGSGGLGFQALNSLTTGLFNVGIGEDAGRSITTGNRNVAVGPLALCSVTTVSDNVGIGVEALRRNTTGTANIAIGTTSLVFNTTGVSNVAIGCDAGRGNTTGSGNVFIGTCAGRNGDNVGRSVAVGELSQRNAVAGQCNTSVGWSSLENATGSFNTALGTCAGSFITTGGNNVAIGFCAQVAFGDQFNQLAIGYNAGCNWLTGDGDKHIRPGAGIRDCTNSLGSSGQVLTTTGGAIQWASASGVPGWTYAGALGSGNAVPLFTSSGGTIVINAGYNGVWKQQVGTKIWNVIYQVRATSAATLIGAGGDWVFNLPSGLNFDTNGLPFQNVFTGFVGNATHQFRQYFLPGPSMSQLNTNGNGSELGAGVVVWSGNQFRFVVGMIGTAPRAVATNFFGDNSELRINIGFQFQTL
jgi:hypothetical protein